MRLCGGGVERGKEEEEGCHPNITSTKGMLRHFKGLGLRLTNIKNL